MVGECGEANCRKIACRKLREARNGRVGEVTLSQLRENYRRARKE